MNIDKYKTFLACVDARTFYEAADLLYTTPSTVSKHIAALEAELGCMLFERTPKGLILTPEGERRVPSIRQIVNSYEKLVGISDGGEPQALVIPSVPLFKRLQLDEMLDLFAETHHDIPFEIQEMTYLFRHLEDGDIQFAFLHMATDLDSDLVRVLSFPLGRTGVIVKNEHPFAGRESISVSELAGEKLIAQGNKSIRDAFSGYFKTADIAPRVDFIIEREDMVVLQVRKTGKIALSTSDDYAVYKPTDLTFVPFTEGYQSTGQLVMLKNAALTRSVRTFLTFAEEWLRENRGAEVI